MPEVTAKKPLFSSRQDALNFLQPARPVFQDKVEAMNFLNQPNPQVAQPDTQQVAEPSSQGFSFNVPDFLKPTIPPRSPGSPFAAPSSTAVQPRITSPEDFFAGQNLPQQQVQAREGPIEVTREERREQFAQRAADVAIGDIGSLIQGQVPKTPENKPIISLRKFSDMSLGEKVLLALAPSTILTKFELEDAPPSELIKRGGTKLDVFGKAVIHGAFPLIANKIPIAQKERENLEEKFPITFMAGEFTGATLPIISSFKATEFALKPIILSLAKSLVESSKAKQFGTKLGLKLTKGALAGSLFEVLSGRKPTPETAAFFALFEVAIPGSQKAFDVAIKDVIKAKTKVELQAVTKNLNEQLASLRRIGGKSQLESAKQRDVALGELAKASKTERAISLEAGTTKKARGEFAQAKGREELQKAKLEAKAIDAVRVGRNELRKAKAEFDKLQEATVLTKKGKTLTARIQNILEDLKSKKKLRQSQTGRELLRQSLKLQESIGDLRKKALPKTEVIQRKGKPPVVTGEKAPRTEARTQAEIESFGKLNKFLTAEQKIDSAKVGILDKAISDFADGRIRQGELIAKFNDSVVKKAEKVAEKPPVAEKQVLEQATIPETGQQKTKSIFEEAPNIGLASIEAKKQVNGKFKLFFRGTRNEVFPGEVFESSMDANNFFKAEKVKAQASPKPKEVPRGETKKTGQQAVPQVAGIPVKEGKLPLEKRTELLEKAGLKKEAQKLRAQAKEPRIGVKKETDTERQIRLKKFVESFKDPIKDAKAEKVSANVKETLKTSLAATFKQKDSGNIFLLSKNISGDRSKWRITFVDKVGVDGHSLRDTKEQAIDAILGVGPRTEAPPGLYTLIKYIDKTGKKIQIGKEAPKRPAPTPVEGGKPQENLALGVQATVPPGKIKTVQGEKTGLFAPKEPKEKQADIFEADLEKQIVDLPGGKAKIIGSNRKFDSHEQALKALSKRTKAVIRKGTKIKVGIEAEDPVLDILGSIKLRKKDRGPKGELSPEMQALQSRFRNKKIFDPEGQTLDEFAANRGITEEQLRQQLLTAELPTVRVRKLKEDRAFFLENKKAGIEAEKEFKKAGEPHINEKGELVSGNKVLFQASGGMAGLETDDEGNPTFNANRALAGVLATSVGVNVLRSHRVRRFGTLLIEKIQNSQIRIRQLQELSGVKLIGKALDPYETEKRYHGRIDFRLRATKKIGEDIDAGIAKVEKNFAKNFPAFQDRDFQSDAFLYLISKHAPEYNAALGKNAAGMTTREAEKTLIKLRNLPYFSEIKRTADQIKKLSDATLDILADGQIISKKVRDDLRKKWPEYISFQRILENVDNTQLIQVLSGGKGISVVGTGLKRAKGSQLEISDVLTNSVANVEQAFVRAEKNIVALSTLEFARNNPQLGLFRELKFGKVKDAKRVEQPTLPLKNVLPFESIPVKDVSAITGKPIFDTQKLFRDESILGIRENGKQVFLRVLDPSLAAAFRMTGQKELGALSRAVGAFTRYVTATATRFNPAFQIPNLLRDTQEMAVFLTAQKEFGIEGAAATTGRIPKSMSDIYDALFLGKDTPGARLYKQMQADGGTTGGLSLSTRKKLEIDITKIRKSNRSHPRKVLKEVVKFFDNYNALFEDATRLSVYKESLARGLTRKEAAVFAKEATINFNTKGIIGAHMNAWYAFANASVQGSTKMIRAMKDPKTAAAVTSAVFSGVLAQNKWNDMVDPNCPNFVSLVLLKYLSDSGKFCLKGFSFLIGAPYHFVLAAISFGTSRIVGTSACLRFDPPTGL